MHVGYAPIFQNPNNALSDAEVYRQELRLAEMAEHFGRSKGYEFYSHVGRYIERHGTDGAARDFAQLMPWGTPEQVLDKLSFIRDKIIMNAVMCHFSYAGMPYDEAERNMQCFTQHVLPELKKWHTTPLTEPKERTISAV
jgi:hypothetical protein